MACARTALVLLPDAGRQLLQQALCFLARLRPDCCCLAPVSAKLAQLICCKAAMLLTGAGRWDPQTGLVATSVLLCVCVSLQMLA